MGKASRRRFQPRLYALYCLRDIPGLNEEDFLSEFDLARGDQTMAAPAPYRNQLPAAPKWIPALAMVAPWYFWWE